MEETWVKSTYSSGADNCVEVWCAASKVRDSKAPERGVLAFTGGGWLAFVSAVKSGMIGR